MRASHVAALLLIAALAIAACGPAGQGTAAPTGQASSPSIQASATPGGLPAAGPTAAATAGTAGRVRIGSKDFTEELLLGEMYALLLENAGVPVERKLNLAGTQVAHDALVKGEIDLYPEYTGTGYLFILGLKGDQDPATVYQKTAAEYKSKWNLVWLDPAPMNDTNAIACTQDAAQKYSLKTLSDLSKQAANIRFAAIPDFPQRPDGLAGLKATYGGFDFKEMTVYDPGLKYKAVTDGKADCVIAFSTDGQISAYKLVLMQDDKGLWPPYQVAPVVRSEVLAAYPQIQDALSKLAPLITNETISALNWKVDGDKQDYTEVAKQFLQEKGLIQ